MTTAARARRFVGAHHTAITQVAEWFAELDGELGYWDDLGRPEFAEAEYGLPVEDARAAYLADELQSTWEAFAAAWNLMLEVAAPIDLAPPARCDPDRFRQGLAEARRALAGSRRGC